MKSVLSSMLALLVAVGSQSHGHLQAQETANLTSYTAVSRAAALDAGGALRGQLRLLGVSSAKSLDGIQLSIVRPDGRELTTTTDAQGMFAVMGQQAGIYSIMARGPGIVLSQSLQVVGPSSESTFPTQLFGMSQLDADIERALSAPVASVATASSSAAPLPESIPTANGRVMLTADGRLNGRLWSAYGDMSGTAITVYQNGIVVARVLAGAGGRFEMPLAAGFYGVVASGPAGHAAVGFEAVGSQPKFSSQEVPSNVRFIALAAAQVPDELNLGLTAPPLPPARPVPTPGPPQGIVQIPPQLPPTSVGGGVGFSGGGGGFGGGGGGGFGGGGGRFGAGGFGGIAGLLGVGGLAAGIAAVAANNDNVPVVSASGQ